MAAYDVIADDDITLSAAFKYVLGVIQADTVQLFEIALRLDFMAGAIVKEGLRLTSQTSTTSVFSLTVPEIVSFLSNFIHAVPATITDQMILGDAQHIAWAMTIMQGLKLGSNYSGSSARYGLSILEAILLNDSLLHFFGLMVEDGLVISPSASPSWAFARLASDGFNFTTSLLANTLFVRVISEDVGLDDESLVKAIFNSAVISENICLTGGWVDPGTGEFTTWAINTRTSAVTEYQNYVFNSFAKIGDSYYGASSTGLYLLEGPTDNGANIVADLKSGFIQLGGSRYTQLEGVYLGIRSDDNARDFILKICTPGTQALPDGATYIYRFSPKNMRTTKINIGKGLRTRYFSWELLTPGPEFDLDSLEFVPLISKRRI